MIGQRTDGNRLCILSGERERDHKSIPVSARGHWLFPKRNIIRNKSFLVK